MLAIHDKFSYQLRSRLQTTSMALGLVRLLQDARRFEEARTTLSSLENGFPGFAEVLDKPSQKPCKANRMKETNLCNEPTGDDFLVTVARPSFLAVSPGSCLPFSLTSIGIG